MCLWSCVESQPIFPSHEPDNKFASALQRDLEILFVLDQLYVNANYSSIQNLRPAVRMLSNLQKDTAPSVNNLCFPLSNLSGNCGHS
jgi:hypothetical protein